MALEVAERIHIMPVGYEHDRVVDSAKRFKADKVILIEHTDNDETGQEYWERVQETLDENHIEYEASYECDIFDLYDSIGTIAEAISEYEEHDVHVNISTGSKVTAVAGMIASTVSNATAYYAKAREYSKEKEEAPIDIDDVFELPHYPIEAPDQQQVRILAILYELTVERDEWPTKGQLIHTAEQNNLEFTKRDVQRKAKYRLLDNQILDPLEERGYLTIKKEGRNKVVGLTDEGIGAYQAFKALIDEEELRVDLGTLDEAA